MLTRLRFAQLMTKTRFDARISIHEGLKTLRASREHPPTNYVAYSGEATREDSQREDERVNGCLIGAETADQPFRRH